MIRPQASAAAHAARAPSVPSSRLLRGLAWSAGAILLSWAGAAAADPCGGRLPTRPGEVFSGTVRYVGDGDSLCVGAVGDPETWIEVRLSDFDAPELNQAGGRDARKRLRRVAFGRPISCRAVRGRSGRVVSHDRVIAACSVGGRPLGRLLADAGGRPGGN